MPQKKTSKTNKKYKIGLVMSGGGARGYAHIGALKALNELGIFPDVISGTSAGALIGALYADDNTPDKILEIFEQKKFTNFVKFSFPKTGLLKMSGLEKMFSKHLKAKTFEQLKLPLFVCSTNMNSGKVDFFSSGKLLDKILASSAIPVLFDPIKINDSFYADGGVINNLPIEPLEKICEMIIGINVNPIGEDNNCTNILKISARAFHLSFASQIRTKSKKFDLFIEPSKLNQFSIVDIKKGKEIFDIGYKTTKRMLKNYLKKEEIKTEETIKTVPKQ